MGSFEIPALACSSNVFGMAGRMIAKIEFAECTRIC